MRMISQFLLVLFFVAMPLAGQSVSGGTIGGRVTDATGAALPEVVVVLENSHAGYRVELKTDAKGEFRFHNVPMNRYQLQAELAGFAPFRQAIDVRHAVPQRADIRLEVAGQQTAVEVKAYSGEDMENVPYAHTDADAESLRKLPVGTAGSRLSDAILLTAPGVVADSDGFFHPLGDHAQVGFSVDGQPVTDQQSKRFSTQMPLNAIQSMELITGAPSAEYGDKTSLVVNAVTKSGLGLTRMTGTMAASYGSFGSVATENTLGMGGKRWGNFLVANAERTGRFLDTPEFRTYHGRGNSSTVFDRMDYQPDGKNSFHVVGMAARNWFQIPNSLAALDADQRQQARTINLAPSYQRVVNAETLFTLGAFFRKDWVDFSPSRSAFADTPVSASQSRQLANAGFKTDVARVKGRWNAKAGVQYTRTGLRERFALGITHPDELEDGLTPALAPYDLTQPGGRYFQFAAHGAIQQVAAYGQSEIRFGQLVVNLGLRLDHYDGLVVKNALQPRGGLSYRIAKTGTVLRASYSRTMETPYNENLLLSSSTGTGGLAANVFFGYGARPLEPGMRNQYNAGFQQAVGRYVVVEGDYFWKFTRNAYDFGVLFNTPITFPVSWYRSKIDGASVRVSMREWRGLQVHTALGTARARFFPGSTGGLLFASPLEEASVFRIDHDQRFQQNTHLHYQYKKGLWMSFSWRYDSGLVTTGVTSCEDGANLSADEKAAIGFAGDATACSAQRLRIPAPGTENADHNPTRIRGRNLFYMGAGHENIFQRERFQTSLRVGVANVTNNVALYNFKSTFGGTHFVAPRAYTVTLGVRF